MNPIIKSKYVQNPRIDNFYSIIVEVKSDDAVAQEHYRLVTPCSESVVLSSIVSAIKNPNYIPHITLIASKPWYRNSRGYKEYKGYGLVDGDWDTLETLLPQLERLRFEKVEVIEKQKVVTYQEVVKTEL